MWVRNSMAAALLLACASPLWAQSAAELDDIRRQIRELRDAYEQRIGALEQRLKNAEAAAQRAPETRLADADSAAPPGAAESSARQGGSAEPEPEPAGGQANSSAFNPGISLILQGAYRNASEDPRRRGITGYAPAGSLDLPRRGFSLDESELTLSANVDHLFYGEATLALHDGQIEAEEAFIQTLALGSGLTVKAGRFFSNIGALNSFHAHAWDFADSSLVQNVFLGNNLGIDGVQANWIAPLPVFVEIGGEIGMPVEFPFSDTDSNRNGITGATIHARHGGDLGERQSYRLGAWYLKAQNRIRDVGVLDFDQRFGGANTLAGGDTDLWGLDLVWKWAPDGNAQRRNVKVRAEWMQRRQDGALTSDLTGSNDSGAFSSTHSGWYVQGVYQFQPEWRLGLRYDRLDRGRYRLPTNLSGLIGTPDFAPQRLSAMLDWNPSEFSRVRLQYNLDKSEQGVSDDQIFLQYIFSLGAHGAHKY